MKKNCYSDSIFYFEAKTGLPLPIAKICFILSSLLILFIFIFTLLNPNDSTQEISKPPNSETKKSWIYRNSENFAEITNVVRSKAAEALPKNGSVFCWILTSPKYFSTRVPAVNETWLKRCDHGQFFTTLPIEDETIPFSTVFSGLDDSYEQLFYKTMKGFYYAYVNVSNEFDWYMKADDDSYVIIEHLKEYLDQFNASEPYYLGYRFKPFIVSVEVNRNRVQKTGYNSGGAAYLLSRGAVKLFVEKLYQNKSLCPYDPSEDLGLGKCLASVNVFATDTRNMNDQHRFFPYSFKRIFETTEDDPLYTMWPEKRAFAPEMISIHHQTPAEIRIIDILLYRLNNPRESKYFNSENVK